MFLGTRFIALLALFLCLGACAVMHHTQIGEVNSAQVLKGKRFEIRVSEIGISMEETGAVARLVEGKTGQALEGVAAGFQDLCLSRYSTSHGFFSWTNKIQMKGYCITL